MEFIKEVLGILSQYHSYLLSGVGYTMLIALIGTAAGFLIGLLTGVIRTAPVSKNAVIRALHKLVNAIIAVYIEVFRGTPMTFRTEVSLMLMTNSLLIDGRMFCKTCGMTTLTIA